MKFLPFALALSACGATFTISPAINYDCTNGFATDSFTWSGASGPIEIRVLKPNGSSMTGISDTSGSVQSGNWVTDGMQFFLVNQAGVTEGQVTARVRCGSTVRTAEVGFAGGSYFPLQVGNTWIYRTNNRVVTNDYVVRTITGTEIDNGRTYYVVTQTYPGDPSVVMKLRSDNDGVLWILTGASEKVYLDPKAPPSKGSFIGLLGTFDDAVIVTSVLGLETVGTVLARGIGIVNVRNTLNTGSSGGFASGLDLIEARIDSVVLGQPASRLSLSIENPILDLTDQLVPNCKIPCYFTACGIAGADSPDTYRPCAQTRIESSFVGAHSVQLQFFNPSGSLVYDTTAQVGAGGGVEYLRLPLYTTKTGSSTPVLLFPGIYRLAARLIVEGVEVGQDYLTVRID